VSDHHRSGAGWLRHWAIALVPALMILGVAAPVILGHAAPADATMASAGSTVSARSVVDPACNGGTGRVISAPASWLAGAPQVATTMLPTGVTLVVISSGYPAASYAVVHAFTSSCAPDPSFGDDGVEQLSFGGKDFSVAAVVPASGGGALLAGQSSNGWLVARIAAGGALDPAFGRGGWTVLPWSGGASAITQAPSGAIVVSGSKGGGCCVEEWVGELSADGAPVTHFGSGGRTRVASLEDSLVVRVAVESDGDILALTEGGNMGCWGTAVAALTASGAPVPSFVRNFETALGHAAPSGVFVADLVARGGSFRLFGTGQSACVTNVASPSAAGRTVSFQPDGNLQTTFAHGGEATFVSGMDDPVWALPQPGGATLVVGMPAAIQASARSRATLNLVDISPTGRVDPSYGTAGRAQLPLPYLNQSDAALAIPVTVATDGKVSVVVSSTANGKALELQQFLG
jgi:hypothetical protein